MPRRKAVAGILLAAGSAAGALLLRQRGAQRVEKADIHFADGTMLSLAPGSADGEALLALGREALRETHG
jgi:hypothetical protein